MSAVGAVELGESGVPARIEAPTASALALIATLAATVVAQGGFYAPARWMFGIGLVTAGVLAHRRVAAHVAPRVMLVAAASLAGWAIVRGGLAGSLVGGLNVAALLAAIAVVVFVCRRATVSDAETITIAVAAMGAGVALSGWIGVAFHVRPWAVTGATTWRAASALTYPNAAAAVLWPLALLVAAHRIDRARTTRTTALLTMLVSGALATQSRGGVVAFAVGIVVLSALGGTARLLQAMLGPAIGGTVALAGLWPSVRVEGDAKPVLALGGLALGLAIAIAWDRLTGFAARWLGLIAVFAGVVAIARGADLGAALGDRIRLAPAERGETTASVVDVISGHALFGVGPGRLVIAWRTPGGLLGTQLVHNEYLQLVAELGLVGGLLLLAMAVAVGRALADSRRRAVNESPPWSGVVAAFGALVVHSAFDFLWHIPAIPLLAAVLFGLSVRAEPTISPTQTQQRRHL